MSLPADAPTSRTVGAPPSRRITIERSARLVALSLLWCLSISIGCDRGAKKKEEQGGESAALDAGRTDASSSQGEARDASTVRVDEPREVPPLAPPLREVPPERDALAERVPGERIGTLTGEIFGEDRPIRAVVRASCGQGTIVQFVYSLDEESDELYVTPPVLLQAFGLPIGREVSYDDQNFTIVMNLEADAPERLAGSVELEYTRSGATRTYMKATFDGDPLGTLLPPRLPDVDSDERRQLRTYSTCIPSGYFVAEGADGSVMARGLVNAIDVQGRGAALLHLVFSEHDTLRLLIVPHQPDIGVPEPFEFTLRGARQQNNRPAAVIADLRHVPSIISPERMTTKNIGIAEDAILVEGKGELSIRREEASEPWEIRATFEELQFPSTIPGALSGRYFSRLRIRAHLISREAVRGTLPPRPDWFEAEAGGSEEGAPAEEGAVDSKEEGAAPKEGEAGGAE
jgi:hypothetical protein